VPLFQEQLLRMAMSVGGFTGGEAEELRRAMGFKRSVARMREIEARLRRGMAARGIVGAVQETIIKSITSFALYGFPESHAASFALLAYASAYLRRHHLAAFTCALLNNWPMGFYHPATLVKDAQRHGLHVLPVDVTISNWKCALDRTAGSAGGPPAGAGWGGGTCALRLGLRYVAGLRVDAGERIEAARAAAPFTSIDDVAHRAALRDDELQTLAHAGAFAVFGLTRRAAMWQATAVSRDPLFREGRRAAPRSGVSPLPEMSDLDRTLADYTTLGLTAGAQLMKYLRPQLEADGVLSTRDLARVENGSWVKVAGLVIVRQRPGSAKGFCFLTLEDETGLGNAVVMPDMFQRHRAVIHSASLLLVEGPVQRVEEVIHVRARHFTPLCLPAQAIAQTGHGYRMRVTPEDDPPPALPKSHDFR
jgi:error-prone DNA polymerase